jgi:hypothetical protein
LSIIGAVPARRKHHTGIDRAAGAEGDDLAVRNVTGKELSDIEELSARLTTLVEMLDEKGLLNKREYQRTVAMRLHEISKAGAIGELDKEL